VQRLEIVDEPKGGRHRDWRPLTNASAPDASEHRHSLDRSLPGRSAANLRLQPGPDVKKDNCRDLGRRSSKAHRPAG
jgi:hypothetical protein